MSNDFLAAADFVVADGDSTLPAQPLAWSYQTWSWNSALMTTCSPAGWAPGSSA
jgi:hypothetical protein